ncbi:GATA TRANSCRIPTION FACTOR 25 [Salix purpurea]|uniref:GATA TRANSCRIPTION FACTOR 25 n=1 Tax=Salix purpurea TaxID=77065 RepID=A0A9Q0UTE3_SALPP|nr:GATA TRANSCRIPTION FACTOR 25 [Salix purpurea]
MQRNKGQFTSAKKSEGGYGWDGGQDSGLDDSQQETLCTHCGTNSKSTPMMRRGPSGPRSLCNACGLFWANRVSILLNFIKCGHTHTLIPRPFLFCCCFCAKCILNEEIRAKHFLFGKK